MFDNEEYQYPYSIRIQKPQYSWTYSPNNSNISVADKTYYNGEINPVYYNNQPINNRPVDQQTWNYDEMLKFIDLNEGFSGKPYANNTTVGYGFTDNAFYDLGLNKKVADYINNPMSREEASKYLIALLKRQQTSIDSLLGDVKLNQNQMTVLHDIYHQSKRGAIKILKEYLKGDNDAFRYDKVKKYYPNFSKFKSRGKRRESLFYNGSYANGGWLFNPYSYIGHPYFR